MAQRSLHLLFLSTAVAGLAACGGGGGGGGSDPPAPTPAAQGSGLPAATATISQSSNTARNLASRVAYVYQEARGGSAAVALGSVVPDTDGGTVACSSGQVTYVVGTGDTLDATFDACVVDGYTFNGEATVSYVPSGSSLQSYTVAFAASDIDVTLPNAQPLTLLQGEVECTAASGGGFRCVAAYRDVNWGNDFEFNYTTNLANGSTGCRCGATNIVNVHATNLGADSGTAEITGRDDSAATITRTGAQVFEVELTGGGSTVTYDFDDIDPEA